MELGFHERRKILRDAKSKAAKILLDAYDKIGNGKPISDNIFHQESGRTFRLCFYIKKNKRSEKPKRSEGK